METNIGTLNNKDIENYCYRKELISNNFKSKNIRQACYELRASNTYYDISNNAKKIVITDKNKYILIKPKQIIVIITEEELYLPKDIIGRILSKGSLFSIGIAPVNTYADPGFSGKMGIIFNNLSNNYIKINPLTNIAKIEFSKLENEVTKPYDGQHGYQTEIWPIKKDLILTDEDIKNDDRIYDPEKEILLSYGSKLSGSIKRILGVEKKIVGSIILYSILNLLLIGTLLAKGNDFKSIFNPLFSVMLGLISNILFTIFTKDLLFNKRR